MAISSFILACLQITIPGAQNEPAKPTLFELQPDLLPDTPKQFPRFFFSGSPSDACWLSRYLWYHFKNRLGHGPGMFNQEYLTTSDLWMADALHPGWQGTIQQIIKNDLLQVRIDPEGYIHTHQHFSHAHEQGWPFPMWTQAQTGPEGFTAGWHFQDDGIGWVWEHYLRHFPNIPFCRQESIQGWTLENVESSGIINNKWQLRATGISPTITTPEGIRIDAFNAPFLQLRWKRENTNLDKVPYVEWMRESDDAFSPERRVYFVPGSGNPDYEAMTQCQHLMATMYRHPLWKGFIKRLRICLAPGENRGDFALDSFFTVYDTRHPINNPVYIMACWNYFRWTGDLNFLHQVIGRMRMALRYQQTVMNGLKLNHIRNEWPGHDGLPGYTTNPDGTITLHYGHGIGNNYWDLLPFGWDDMYSTAQYYASLRIMATLERAIKQHPEWGLPDGPLASDPDELEKHAEAVKQTANAKFWNPETKRFFACIDQKGNTHDYGFTFLNLDAIWYGIATDEHAKDIMDWLEGNRTVPDDTSVGEDIYFWRFGPRATTRRNIEWYGQGWIHPERIPWGGQIQDGGAVLGFTFYDLMARLRVLGPDNAWNRLREIIEWEREVWSEGGYRPYYEKRGVTLQGGGTAGGIGIDFEFFESSLLPSIVVYGFLGAAPTASELVLDPQIPSQSPEIGIANLYYRDTLLDVLASRQEIVIHVKQQPPQPITIRATESWQRADSSDPKTTITISKTGTYRFRRSGD